MFLKRVIMKILLLLCFVGVTFGFLLDSTNSATSGKQTYLTVAEYYGDKSLTQQEFDKIRQELISYHADQGKNLNLLAAQLQDKLNAFETKLQGQTIGHGNSGNQQSVEALDHKYRELEKQYRELQYASDGLKEENEILKNKTSYLEQKVEALNQLKNGNHSQSLQELNQKTDSLKTIVEAFSTTEQARGQDFLALHNKVNLLEINGQTRDTLLNATSAGLSNLQKNLDNKLHVVTLNQAAMENKQTKLVLNLETRTTQQILNLKSTLNSSVSRFDDQLQPVILTACQDYHSSRHYGRYGAMNFPTIKTAVGIHNITSFKSTGKFRCEVPGYYLIILTMETQNSWGEVQFMLNSLNKHRQYMTYNMGNGFTSSGIFTSGTGAISLHLRENYEVWIKLLQSNTRLGDSCLTIVKIN